MGPITATLQALPSGEAGVDQTLRYMAQLVRSRKRDHRFRELSLSLIRHLPQKSYGGEASALHAFVRDRIRYVRDIRGIETLQTPEITLRLGQGDCDDKATLLATLLEVIGHPTRFVAVAVNGNRAFSHVFVETKIGNTWYPLETTEPWAAGIESPTITKRKVFHI